MTPIAAPDVRRTESARQTLQERIDAGRSAAERNRFSQFATPNALAVEIAREVSSLAVERKTAIRFADPAVGSGSFYSAALAVFGRKQIASAVGVELDPAFAGAARDLWSGRGLEVVEGDFTRVVAGKKCPPPPQLGSGESAIRPPPPLEPRRQGTASAVDLRADGR